MADLPDRGSSGRSTAHGSGSRAASRRSMRTYLAGAVGVIALIIIVQNSQSVDVEILFATISTPLVFALLGAFALGALTGWLLPRVRRGRKRGDD